MMHRRLRFIRFSLLTAVASLALASPSHAAEGVKLAWNHCFGEGTGVQNMTFACDTNAGNHTLVASFVLGADIPAALSVDGVLDIASASAELPAWWMVHTNLNCRVGIGGNILADPANQVCLDWWYGGQGLATAFFCSNVVCPDGQSANTGRVNFGGALTLGFSSELTAGEEYFAVNMLLNNAKTVGSPSCGGCSVPVCIVFSSLRLTQQLPGGNDNSLLLTTAAVPGSNFVTWQGGGVPASRSIPGCPAVTATHRSAWGEVKALYR